MVPQRLLSAYATEAPKSPESRLEIEMLLTNKLLPPEEGLRLRSVCALHRALLATAASRRAFHSMMRGKKIVQAEVMRWTELQRAATAKEASDEAKDAVAQEQAALVLKMSSRLPQQDKVREVWAQLAECKDKNVSKHLGLLASPGSSYAEVLAGAKALKQSVADRLTDKQKPHLDAIGITVYQNPDAMVSAFKAGEIDSMDKVPVTLVKQLEADPGVQIRSEAVPDVINIGFNSNPKKTNKRELLDIRVKQAMAHAVDRDRIIETVYNGYAMPAASILTPIAGDFLNPNVKPEVYDIALANSILDEAGYAMGADGIRQTPEGTPMSYEVIMPMDIQGQQRKFDILQEDWRKIGIEVTARPMDGSAAGAAMMAPDGKYLDFDIHMWSWLGYIDPDFMLMTVMCDQLGNWSDVAYCNPEYDKLYKEQGAEMDPVKRQAIVWEMQEILQRDHPYIFIAQSEFARAFQKNWGGLTPVYLLYVSKIPWDTIHQTG